MTDIVIETMEKHGLCFNYKSSPLNADYDVYLFTDRCDVKTKQSLYVAICISGLEILQGKLGIIDKCDNALRTYNAVMEQAYGHLLV